MTTAPYPPNVKEKALSSKTTFVIKKIIIFLLITIKEYNVK